MAMNNTQQETNPTGAPAPKRRLAAIIALAAATIIAASGGFAWYQSMQGAHLPEKHEAPAPVFVVLEPITVNLQSDAQENQYLQIALTVQVNEAADAEMMKVYMPQVRSRLLLLLSSQRASDIGSAEGKRILMQQILAKLREPYSNQGPTQRVMSIHFTSFVIQ